MADLAIDGEALANAVLSAVLVVDAFDAAASDAHDAAEHVGHGGLATRVEEFADGWDIRRGKFSQELRELAAQFEAIGDTFTDLDSRTATELRSAISAAGNATAGAQRGVARMPATDSVRGASRVREP